MKHFTWSDLTPAHKLQALARPEGLSDTQSMKLFQILWPKSKQVETKLFQN